MINLYWFVNLSNGTITGGSSGDLPVVFLNDDYYTSALCDVREMLINKFNADPINLTLGDSNRKLIYLADDNSDFDEIVKALSVNQLKVYYSGSVLEVAYNPSGTTASNDRLVPYDPSKASSRAACFGNIVGKVANKQSGLNEPKSGGGSTGGGAGPPSGAGPTGFIKESEYDAWASAFGTGAALSKINRHRSNWMKKGLNTNSRYLKKLWKDEQHEFTELLREAESAFDTVYYIENSYSIEDETDLMEMLELYLQLNDDIKTMEENEDQKHPLYRRAVQLRADLSDRLEELQTQPKIIPEMEFESDYLSRLGFKQTYAKPLSALVAAGLAWFVYKKL